MRKVSVIGGGNVGATAALYIAERGIADVTLVDILEGVPQGKALDLLQSRSVRGFDSKITGTNDFRDIAGSDVILQTAGFPRKPGMSRTDLLKANAEIIEKAAAAIREFAPNAVVICVTNPLDAMTWLMFKRTGFPPARVMGMAGVLDSARFCCFIAEELGVSPNDVQAMVLGGHGDSMVPLPRYTTVSGISLPDLLSKEKIDALVKRTAAGGAEIVSLLKTGSAYYAPAASAAQMVEAVLLDRKRILPAAAYLDGIYGLKDVYCGVPIKLGAKGVEQILELTLSAEELAALQKSAADVSAMIAELG
ncbi:MAG: malate dehydrogenase [Candidatus Eisenbacteria bacterium]|nr:malate dehydrogenase [Candidatus Eisenbacteria bacterium]